MRIAGVRKHHPLYLGMVLVLVLILVGCGRGVGRQVSWPGMIVVDGTVYAAALERVVALDAETGEAWWTYPEVESRNNGIGPFYATPVLDESRRMLIVAGFEDKAVYALALGETPADPPTLRWTFTDAQGQYVGSGTLTEQLFLIGNGDGRVYALRLDDGELAWSFVTNDRVWATPLVVDSTVYVASLDHHLYALDVETGQEKWRLPTQGAIAATPVYYDGSLWIGDFASTLYRVDPERGNVLWSREVEDWLWATPVVYQGILYVVDVGGNVYALDLARQEMVWAEPARVGDVVHARPVVVPEQGILLVAGYNRGEIHAVDLESGSLLNWGAVLPDAEKGRLPGDLVTDGTRLFLMPTLVRARVQALDLSSGKLLWVYPPSPDVQP